MTLLLARVCVEVSFRLYEEREKIMGNREVDYVYNEILELTAFISWLDGAYKGIVTNTSGCPQQQQQTFFGTSLLSFRPLQFFFGIASTCAFNNTKRFRVYTKPNYGKFNDIVIRHLLFLYIQVVQEISNILQDCSVFLVRRI